MKLVAWREYVQWYLVDKEGQFIAHYYDGNKFVPLDVYWDTYQGVEPEVYFLTVLEVV